MVLGLSVSAAAAAAPTGLNNLGDAISPQTAS